MRKMILTAMLFSVVGVFAQLNAMNENAGRNFNFGGNADSLVQDLQARNIEEVRLVWFEKKSRYFNPFDDFMMLLQHSARCSGGPKEYVWWFSDLEVDGEVLEDSVEFELARIQAGGFDVTKFRVVQNMDERDRTVFVLLFTEEQLEAISECFDSDEDEAVYYRNFLLKLSPGQLVGRRDPFAS